MHSIVEQQYADFKSDSTHSTESFGGSEATPIGYNHETTFFPPSANDPDPHPDYGPKEKYERRPVDHHNIIDDKKCINQGKGKGDGHFDVFTGVYTEYRCVSKDCQRHWRRYARQTYRKLRNKFGDYPHWSFVRLSTFSGYTEQVKRALNRFHEKLKSSHRRSQSIGIYHTGKSGVHIHLIIGTHEPIDEDNIRKSWKAHFPSKKNHEFTPYAVNVKKAKNPLGCLWYALMGRNKKLRKLAPWRGLSRRFPYQVWKCDLT